MAVQQKFGGKTSVNAVCANSAAQEQCRTLVLETKELAKKLTKPELERMFHSHKSHSHTACPVLVVRRSFLVVGSILSALPLSTLRFGGVPQASFLVRSATGISFFATLAKAAHAR